MRQDLVFETRIRDRKSQQWAYFNFRDGYVAFFLLLL